MVAFHGHSRNGQCETIDETMVDVVKIKTIVKEDKPIQSKDSYLRDDGSVQSSLHDRLKKVASTRSTILDLSWDDDSTASEEVIDSSETKTNEASETKFNEPSETEMNESSDSGIEITPNISSTIPMSPYEEEEIMYPQCNSFGSQLLCTGIDAPLYWCGAEVNHSREDSCVRNQNYDMKESAVSESTGRNKHPHTKTSPAETNLLGNLLRSSHDEKDEENSWLIAEKSKRPLEESLMKVFPRLKEGNLGPKANQAKARLLYDPGAAGTIQTKEARRVKQDWLQQESFARMREKLKGKQKVQDEDYLLRTLQVDVAGLEARLAANHMNLKEREVRETRHEQVLRKENDSVHEPRERGESPLFEQNCNEFPNTLKSPPFQQKNYNKDQNTDISKATCPEYRKDVLINDLKCEESDPKPDLVKEDDSEIRKNGKREPIRFNHSNTRINVEMLKTKYQRKDYMGKRVDEAKSETISKQKNKQKKSTYQSNRKRTATHPSGIDRNLAQAKVQAKARAKAQAKAQAKEKVKAQAKAIQKPLSSIRSDYKSRLCRGRMNYPRQNATSRARQNRISPSIPRHIGISNILEVSKNPSIGKVMTTKNVRGTNGCYRHRNAKYDSRGKIISSQKENTKNFSYMQSASKDEIRLISKRLHGRSKQKQIEGKKRREEIRKKMQERENIRNGVYFECDQKISIVDGCNIYYRGIEHVLRREKRLAQAEGIEYRNKFHPLQLAEYQKKLKKRWI